MDPQRLIQVIHPAKSVGQPASTRRLLDIGPLRIPNPSVMGILNVTPDSFSDGGRFNSLDAALHQAERMARDGAALIDIGGESTRPGADDVSVDAELERVIPVIEALRREIDLPLSVDTCKPEVMTEAARAGAAMINDVSALQQDGAIAAAADSGLAICLMHMQGRPRTMQQAPHYSDVVKEVGAFLRERVEKCVAAGIDRTRIVIDPGFGFGKSHAHNIELLANLRQLQSIDLPLLVGLSRKSTLGDITGRDVDERMPASIAAAVIAHLHGARIIRVHDVRETVDALRVCSAVIANSPQGKAMSKQ